MEIRPLSLCAITMAIGCPVCAQTTDSAAVKQQTIELVHVKAKAASATPISKTLGVEHVSRAEVLQSMSNTLMNTLEKLPGISAINTGVGISKPVIRGMSMNRVIVTEYGIKQEGQQWGVDHGLEIDQYNVDHVEIVKGPVSVLYGSDGVGGVINILPPSIPDKDTMQGELITTYKTNNDLYGISGKMERKRGATYVRVRGTYNDYASYRVPANEFTYNGYVLPIYNNRLKNTGGKELNFSATAGIKKQWGWSSIYVSSYRQQAGFFSGAFGIPRAYELIDNGRYRSIDLPNQQIMHMKAIWNTTVQIGDHKLECDIGYQDNIRREHSPGHAHGYGPAPEGNTALELELKTLTAHVRYLLQARERLRNTIGVSAVEQQNKAGGYEFLLPAYKMSQLGVYNFASYTSKSNILYTGGVRLDYIKQAAAASYVNRYDSSGATIGQSKRSETIDNNFFNISGSVGASAALWEQWRIKANVGSAYRAPALVELTANGVHHGTFRHEVGDPNLEPERGYMGDVALLTNYKNGKLMISPFVNYFSNYIYLGPSARFSPLPDAGQVYLYRQTTAIFGGGELSAEWEWTKQIKHITYVEYVWNKNINCGLALPFTPPFSVLNEVSWSPALPVNSKVKQVALSVSGQQFARQYRVDRNEATTEGYFLLNSALTGSFGIGKHLTTVYMQLRNITNAVYQNNMSRYRILNLPEQGINFQLMVKYEL